MRLWQVALAWLAVAGPAWGSGPLRVVATLPDVADWVREVGGTRVDVRSLLDGAEDPADHQPGARDAKLVAGARVLVRLGGGRDPWLEGVMRRARNRSLLVVDLSDPAGPAGTPADSRVWLALDRVPALCQRIARGLESADPAAGDHYQGRTQRYRALIETSLRDLRRQAAALGDRRFVSYRRSWAPFAGALGLSEVDTVAADPEGDAGPRLHGWVERVRAQGLHVLVADPGAEGELLDHLAREADVRLVRLLPGVGARPGTTSLELFQSNARALIEALKASSASR